MPKKEGMSTLNNNFFLFFEQKKFFSQWALQIMQHLGVLKDPEKQRDSSGSNIYVTWNQFPDLAQRHQNENVNTQTYLFNAIIY